jgi:hypothetical protein
MIRPFGFWSNKDDTNTTLLKVSLSLGGDLGWE